jgi:hypothetical protein
MGPMTGRDVREDYGRKLEEIKEDYSRKTEPRNVKSTYTGSACVFRKKHRGKYENFYIKNAQDIVKYSSRFNVLLVMARSGDN